ncbi:MAG TPA: GNAT family N-acetyltransferase, partial [Ktedonobacterales bacterium]
MKIHPISDLPEISRTIKALGRANASTLGYLPEGAFDHYVSQGTVLVTMNEYEECIGYLLWRVARQQAFIVHLCVQANARHKGVAKTLVKELSQRTQSLRGIGLWCRRDYEAHQIWPKLGFTPRAEKPGRSRDGSELTFWWLDHNHPTIFTFAENERLATKVSVVLDANVFFDLNTPRAQNESFALEADWLQDIIELCVTDEIYTEIDRNDDPAERKRLQGAVSKYTLLRHTSDRYSHIFGEIAPLFMKQASKSTLSDHKQLAKAIAADTGFFATRDKDLLKVSDRIYQAYGLAIVRPSEIVVRQDELRREIEYQPVRLAGTLLDIRRIQAHELNSVVETFSRGGMGESKAAFSTILRQNLVTPDHVDCLVALDTTGSMLAVIVLGWHTDELRIPLFRVNKHPLAATLARHLVLRATYQSARRHLRITRMSDRYSGDTVAQALNEASFIHTSDDWLKVNLATVTTACDLADTLGQVALRLGDSGEPYRRLALLLKSDYVKTDIQFMVDVERTLWPAKVTDAAISTYIVPIRPIWAQHLFD